MRTNRISRRNCLSLLGKSASLTTTGVLISPEGTEAQSGDHLVSGTTLSLDGTWMLATDPANHGREHRWWKETRKEAKETKVPWIIQDAFPGYHGVAWYWKDLFVPANHCAEGRYLLKFWEVDYLADVSGEWHSLGHPRRRRGSFCL